MVFEYKWTWCEVPKKNLRIVTTRTQTHCRTLSIIFEYKGVLIWNSHRPWQNRGPPKSGYEMKEKNCGCYWLFDSMWYRCIKIVWIVEPPGISRQSRYKYYCQLVLEGGERIKGGFIIVIFEEHLRPDGFKRLRSQGHFLLFNKSTRTQLETRHLLRNRVSLTDRQTSLSPHKLNKPFHFLVPTKKISVFETEDEKTLVWDAWSC
jgi:hypothetical protein